MKKYQSGGDIPQEVQNALLDRKEEMGRKKFEEDRKSENEAPKKSVKDMYDRVRDMFGVKKKTVTKAKGGKVSSASKRADGCAVKGKTRGRMV